MTKTGGSEGADRVRPRAACVALVLLSFLIVALGCNDPPRPAPPIAGTAQASNGVEDKSAGPSPAPSSDAGEKITHGKVRGIGQEGPRECKGRVAAGGDRKTTELLDKGPCGNLAERARLGTHEEFFIPLDAVSTRRADGTPVVTRQDVLNDIATANRVLSPGGITAFLNSFTISDTISSKVVSNDVGSDPVFATTNTLAVLYVEWYFDGGGVSWHNGTGVVVAALSRPNYQLLAHEIAHSLGLDHTACSEPDDGVADTPLDPGPDGYDCTNKKDTSATCSCNGACPCTGSCTAPLQQYKPDPLNVMAKYGGKSCNERFTPGQYELMRCVIRTKQRARMRCTLSGGGKIPCGDPLRCVSSRSADNCGACGVRCKGDEECTPDGCTPTCPEGCPPSACAFCCTDCEGNSLCGVNRAQCNHIPACKPDYECP